MRKGDTCWLSGRRRPEHRDSLPGDGPGLGVSVVDALLDGLGQDGHVSGIVGEHVEWKSWKPLVPGVLERNTRANLPASSSHSSLFQPDSSGSLLTVGSSHGFLKTPPWVATVTKMGENLPGGSRQWDHQFNKPHQPHRRHSTLKCCWKT